jgi:hypothetical protein
MREASSAPSRMRRLSRRLSAVLLSTVMVGAGLTAIAGSAQAANPGFIRNVAYNQCLDLAGGSFADGTPIGKSGCEPGASRMWHFEYVGLKEVDDIYLDAFWIRSALPGKCVDIHNNGTRSGETAEQQPCNPNDYAQLWFKDIGGTQAVTLLNLNAHGDVIDRALDAPPSGAVRIWSWNHTDVQRWDLPA